MVGRQKIKRIIIEIIKTQEQNKKLEVKAAINIKAGWYDMIKSGTHPWSPGKASPKWHLKRKI